MTEADYIERLHLVKRKFIDDDCAPEPLLLVEEALARYPDSALLNAFVATLSSCGMFRDMNWRMR